MEHLPMIGLIKMRNPGKRERDILKTVQLVKETEKLVTEESMKKDKYALAQYKYKEVETE